MYNVRGTKCTACMDYLISLFINYARKHFTGFETLEPFHLNEAKSDIKKYLLSRTCSANSMVMLSLYLD